MKFTSDLNASLSFEHIVTDEDDAEQVGSGDKKLFDAYMKGYGSEISE
jgi:hypothetical protein